MFRTAPLILAIFVFLLSLLLYLEVSLKELASMELRNKNSLEYFIYVSITSITIIELSLFTARYVSRCYLQPFLTLSKSSLILFCYGNSFLYVIYQNFSFTPVRFFFIFFFFYLLCKFNVYFKGEVKEMRSRFNYFFNQHWKFINENTVHLKWFVMLLLYFIVNWGGVMIFTLLIQPKLNSLLN